MTNTREAFSFSYRSTQKIFHTDPFNENNKVLEVNDLGYQRACLFDILIWDLAHSELRETLCLKSEKTSLGF